MTLRQKVTIYNKLLAGLSKGVKLAALLAREGRTAEKKEVERKNEELARQAAALRRRIHEDWQVEARRTLERVRAVNGKLQARVRAVEKAVTTAETVVSALGYLDDLIGIARKVVRAAAV